MGTPIKTSEITELDDEGSSIHRSKAPCLVPSKANSHEAAGKKHVHPVESDLIELFEAHDSRNLSKITATHPKGIDLLRKNALKKPLKMSTAQASGLGISETMSLKQALRKLCISHASDMAAMKRLSKPIGVSVSSEAGTIKRLYASVVVQSSESDNKGHDKLLEISVVQEKKSSKSSEKLIEPSKKPSGLLTSNKISESSSHDATSTAVKVVKPRIRDVLSSTTDESARRLPKIVGTPKKEKWKSESFISLTKSSDSCKSDVSPRPVKPAVKDKSASVKKGNCDHTSKSLTSLTKSSDSYKSDVSPRLAKQPVKNKGALSKKENSASDKKGYCDHTSESFTSLTKSSDSFKSDTSPRLVKQPVKNKGALSKKENSHTSASGSCVQNNCVEKVVKGSVRTKTSRKEEPVSSSSSAANLNTVSKSTEKNFPETKTDSVVSNTCGANGMKRREFSRSKGECSQSSKSSIGDYSSSTSISDDSNQSGASGIGIRPHMSNDVRWAAIRHVETTDRNIGLRNFKLLKRLGCGDIGTVYLAELSGLGCLFALKVMDNDFLISRKKMMRAQTEREILQMLDHPFLPTLYTHFTTDNLSCLVMEYCPGGDLHVLRQKQLGRSFSEPAARFYVAEVLLALEYLHMLGVVYRDLKPENILVREDGHIMLSDFDLSLRCTVNPSLVRLSSVGKVETSGRVSGVCSESYCIDPLCLQPSWAQVSCFTPRLGSSTTVKTRKHKSDLSTQVRPLPQLVVEPTDARSNSFVGTHEYLAPEIIKGEGHGSSVDWWTFGIFLYELLFGRTPFKGPNNEETLANVVSHSLKFPENPVVSFHARDLIRGLLVKEPENRLGSVKGAAEIKQHPFFAGLNWALIRCATPPEVPQPYDFGIQLVEPQKKSESKFMEVNTEAEGVEFELF